MSDGEGTGSVAIGWWQPRNPPWRPRVVQAEVPQHWREEWLRGRTGDIMEVEAAAPLLGLCAWPTLKEGLWIHFVDNTSAEASMIKGSSRATTLAGVVHTVWRQVWARRLYLWAERVATGDKPIDRASRRDLRDLYGQGWQVDPVPPGWELLAVPAGLPPGALIGARSYPRIVYS